MKFAKLRIGSACFYSIHYLGFAFVVLALTLVSARSAQITWTNPAGGTWNSPLNWSPNQVPGAADTAIITNNSVTVRLDISPTVSGITLGANGGCGAGGAILALNGQTLTLNGPLLVNACGQFTVDSGVLAGTSNATLNGTIGWSGGSLAGTFTLSSQSVLNVSGSNDHNMPGCTLTNLGTVAWSGGRIRGGDTFIYNLGLWDAQSDQVINNDYGRTGTIFNNLGTFRKSGGVSQSTSTVFAGVVFNQLAGVIDVQNGANGLGLALRGGGKLTGGYITTNTLGLTVLSAGDFTINGTVTSSNVVENAGNLVGTNLIQGALQWQSGSWNGAQLVTVAANSTLYVSTTADHNLANCTLTNNGTVAWSNGRIRGGGTTGTVIYNNGIWDSQGDLTWNADYGANGTVFNNFGTFRKSGGASQSTSTVFASGVVFNQRAGVIDVQNGANGLALAFRGGGSFTGGYITTNLLALTVLSGGSFTINGTVTSTNTVQDAGNLVGTNVIQGGLTWVSGSWNSSGPITITTNSTLRIVSINDHNLANCVVTNLGTVAWADGRIRGGGGSRTFINNFGLWDAQNDQVINDDYGTGTVFVNAGTFRKSGGTGTNSTAMLAGVIFNNTGTLDVQTNLVSFRGGGTFTGGAVTGSGLVQLAGGAFTLNGTRTTTNVQLVGGTLEGVNVLTGGLIWVGGSWNNAGPITIPADSTLHIVSGNDHNMANCVVTNLGTVAWADGRIRGGGASRTLINNFGLWDAQNDQVLNADYGTGVVFNNAGTFRKSGGTGTTSLLDGVAFNNTGTLDVPSNFVSLQGGGTFSDGSVTGEGVVQLAGGAYTINGARTTTNVQLFGGTLAGENVFTGGLTWVVGAWNSSGPITISTNSTLHIVSGNDHNMANCVVNNLGTVLWADGRIRGGGGSQTFINNFGLWDAQNDQVINNDYGTRTVFVNAGTLRKSGGTGATSLLNGVTFNNQSGDVEVDSGQLSVGSSSYVQGDGLFAIKLGGTAAGQFGKLITSSSATLGGPFSASLANGFAPAIGNEFQVLASASRSGTFTSLKVPSGISVNYSNNGVFLVVTGPVVPLQITRQPTNQSVAVGATATFTVTATGAAPLTYRWQQNGTDLTDSGNVVGSGTSALTISNVSAANAGTYTVTITDASGSSVTSSNAILSLLGQCVPPPSGLVGWWPGDGNPTDIIGGSNGTLQGGATFAAGQVGQAFRFGGVDGEVIVPHNANQNTGSQITIDAWVNPSSSGHGRTILQKRSAANVGGYGLETVGQPFGPDNGLQFYIMSGGTYRMLGTPTGVLTLNTWQHVAATYDGTTMTIYVNGAAKASTPASGTIDAVTDPLVIGRNVVVPADAWAGLIDEVELFNRALSSNEVAALFNAGSAGQCKPACNPGTIICPTNVVADVPSGQTTFVVNFTAPTVTGNCPGVMVSCTPPSGSAFPLGTTPVLCTGADAAGNTNTCTFTVTINSTTTITPPTLTCPANITTNSAPGQCGRTLAFAPTATGAPVPAVTCRIGATMITSPNLFPIGTTTVSCTASNVAGTASCSFTVTVQDTEPPLITCPAPLTVQCDTDVTAPNPALVKAADNCDLAPVVAHVSDLSVGTCPRIITRTYKATDAAGNSATCTQTITVHDTIAPVISGCTNRTVAATSGQLGATVNLTVTATDNCDGTLPVTCTPAPGYLAVGQTPVRCEAVDRCGNLSSCTFTVTVTATTDSLRLCGFTQGYYGNAKGKFNGNTSFTLVGQLLDQGPLVVGKTGARSLSILPGEAALLQQRMPAGGPPASLPNNGDQTLQTAVLPLNAKGRFADVFLGQTITLSLNVRLSSPLLNFPLTASFCTQGTLAGADGLKGTLDDVPVASDIQMFSLPASVLSALSSSALGINDSTVKGLLELANRALAGLPTGGASLSDINEAVDAINRGFDECRAPANCSTSTVVADSFNDRFTTRPILVGSKGPAAFALPALALANLSSPPVAPLNIRVRSSNLDATKDPTEPDIAGNPGGKSVWWQWQAPRTGPVTIDTGGSSFDTLLGVSTGAALANLVLVASNDDANGYLTSEVTFEAQAGVTYQIAVDGVDGASGQIVLTLIADPPRLCLPLTLASDQVKFCIDGELGRTYTVEASPDLSNWTLLATALNRDGSLQITDPAKSNFRQRYYRVTYEP